MPIVIFILVAALIIVIAVLGAQAAKKRREDLAALAARHGLSFQPERDYSLSERFEFLDALAQGNDRYAYNLISGVYQGHEVMVFDYHYETYSRDSKGRKQTDHHYFSFFILTLPQSFPELRITREGFLSKLAQAFGYDDIDLESAEFSRAFCVRSKDKKFAYDVCNATMMEYLLANRDLSIEIEDRALALAFGQCLAVPGIEMNLGRLLAIRSRLPEYLFTKV